MRLFLSVCQIALGFATGCQSPGATDLSSDSMRLLFIGNSLTYTNDLPAMVDSIARRGPGGSVEVRIIAHPNFGLTEHRLSGEAEAAIRQGGWTLVILQQGPSSLPESRVQLVAEARWFAGVAGEAGVPVALLMVWPDRSRLGFFDDVSTSYRLAADSAGTTLLPAGEAWRAAWRMDSTLQLLGPDGFHPAPLGTYLAALVIVDRVRPAALSHLAETVTNPAATLITTSRQRQILVAAARESNRAVGQ
ncbi:MAG: hypothetical protein ABI587_11265 [Gemmatimonadales bacterium]